MAHPRPFLSLVIPSFNEMARMHKCIDGAQDFRQCVDGQVEIILVDDGSSDGSADLATELSADIPNFQVLRRPHLGKGAALRAGVEKSEGLLIFLADADWSMPPQQIQRFLTDGDESVARIGSRETAHSQRHGEPLRRHLLGRAFNTYVRTMALPGIQDSQCGFKCLPGDLTRDVFRNMSTEGWAFDVELLLRLQQRGCSVEEIGIDWHYDPDTRLKPVRDAAKMAWEVYSIARKLR